MGAGRRWLRLQVSKSTLPSLRTQSRRLTTHTARPAIDPAVIIPKPPASDVKIRLATEADAARIAEIYAPYVLSTCITFELVPPSVDEMALRIKVGLEKYTFLVAERAKGIERGGDVFGTSSGEIIGYAYASSFHPREAYRFSCSISIYLDIRLTPLGSSTNELNRGGRGAGSALLLELLDTLEKRGYKQAFGLIALPNEKSVRLHEKYGFERCALCRKVGWKDGRWVDVGWWQRELGGSGQGVDGGEPEEIR